jgi:hypothetical protein
VLGAGLIDGIWAQGGVTIRGTVAIFSGRPNMTIKILGNNKYIFDFPDDQPYTATARIDGNALYFSPASAADLGTQSSIIWTRAYGELCWLIARMSLLVWHR